MPTRHRLPSSASTWMLTLSEKTSLPWKPLMTRNNSHEAAELRQSFLHHVEDVKQTLSTVPEIARQDPTIPAALKVLKVTLPSQLDTAIQLADAGDWIAVRLRLKTQLQQL